MTRQELINRLQDIEWEDFEVKEAAGGLPKSSWETVSAFANTAGGWIIFGVSCSASKYTIAGVEKSEKLEQDFLNTLRGEKFNRKISAKCMKYKIDDKIVLGFYVPSAPGRDKPVYFNTKANTFIRTGSGDQRATNEEIDAMYRNSSFDKKDEQLTRFTIKSLDSGTIERYRIYLKNINPEHRYNKLKDDELLEKLKAIQRGKVAIGGLLFFGKEESISEYVPDFRVDYLEIRGTSYDGAPERYSYRTQEEINIFNYYFTIIDRLTRKIDVPFKLKGMARDENPPQLIAIREALVNLLMHSDYFSGAKPRIRVFTDRVEFFNPGSLPKEVKYILKEDFSLPRNPTIARSFRILQLAESIGSGFYKMINGWKSYYKSKPEITGDFDYYKIVFKFTPSNSEGVSEGVKIKKAIKELAANSGINITFDYIGKNPGKRIPEIAAATGKPGKSVERWIKFLKAVKKVKFAGSPKTGGYYKTDKMDNKK